MSNGSGIFARLDRIDRRYIFAIVIILVIIPLVNPIGLPLSVSEKTQDTFDAIEDLPPGSMVLVLTQVYVMSLPDIGPGMIAMVQHLFDKDVKIIFVGVYVEAPIVEDIMFKQVDMHDKKYGEDYVRLGYIPGGETAMSAIATDFRTATPVDFYGDSLDEIPLMANYHNAEDVDLVVVFDDSWGASPWVRQFHAAFDKDIVINVIAGMGPGLEPFYMSGQVLGILAGMRSGAEYEKLLEVAGAGIAGMDAQSLIHITIIALVILGNLSMLTQRNEGELN